MLCAELGFGTLYFYTTRFVPETFTSSGRMYVNNGNPNLTEYQYTNSGDLNSAVQLINTYLVVVRSDKVMNAVVENYQIAIRILLRAAFRLHCRWRQCQILV